MNNIFKILKATIISLIVALLFVLAISFTSVKLCKENFVMAISLLEMITIDTDAEIQTIAPVLEGDKLVNYPTFGSKYANLKIESIDVDLPIYYGETYQILKDGIGQDSRSYFPGERGSIVYMGHNYKTFLRRLGEVNVGDIIEVDTEYGNFKYEIYDAQVVHETETDKVPIQDQEEILMIYTCYPFNNIGYAYHRYVVYAKPIGR